MARREECQERLRVDEVGRPAEADQVALAGLLAHREVRLPFHLDDRDVDTERAVPLVDERDRGSAVIGARVRAQRQSGWRCATFRRGLPQRARLLGSLLGRQVRPVEPCSAA